MSYNSPRVTESKPSPGQSDLTSWVTNCHITGFPPWGPQKYILAVLYLIPTHPPNIPGHCVPSVPVHTQRLLKPKLTLMQIFKMFQIYLWQRTIQGVRIQATSIQGPRTAPSLTKYPFLQTRPSSCLFLWERDGLGVLMFPRAHPSALPSVPLPRTSREGPPTLWFLLILTGLPDP